MQSTTFPHVPHDKSGVRYALFRNVENAQNVRQRIVKAATMQGRKGEQEREAVNFGFIDARLVGTSLFFVLSLLDYGAVLPAKADRSVDYEPKAPTDSGPSSDPR